MSLERKKLVKKLDQLCRQILLKRDRRPGDFFYCISCRRLLPLNCANVGHYISRRYESVRWDLRNIALQCVACNKWQSGNLIEYRKALVEMYGPTEVEKMEATYRISPAYTEFDLSLLVKEYQGILKSYEERE